MTIPDCYYRVSIKALVLNETRDKFLICKEDNGLWGLPGGGLDWGKTPHEDLKREIKEEMGVGIASMAERPCYFFTGIQTLNPKVKTAVVIYECTLDSLDFAPSPECQAVMFADKADTETLELFDDVAHLAAMFSPANH